ncbi:pre-mRNA-splicing factor 18-like isoform X1 [Ananas comosus]|uniref:Pre-mRNA-splicing factor 18-like isoform X1 n=1 Tax=Ananas comosus TaxID=4615 RepID=A0A6P5EH50_ANACO|nr:pre-mRNA-splicing factor 18-like isoform X1 [Ananas comosus]
MDLLNRELRRKRQILEVELGGRKLLKRAEIERREIQKLREEELRRIRCKSPPLRPSSPASNPNPSPGSRSPDPETGDLPRHEVIRRLRVLRQPITLFGEDDAARLRRLRSAVESGPVEIDDDAEMMEGQVNDFLRDIYDLRRKQKRFGGGNGDGDKEEGGDGAAAAAADADKDDAKKMQVGWKELYGEDKILVFFKRLLDEWNREVEEMPEAEKRTAKGKSVVATYKQCARYMNPLFKMCRKKALPDDIRKALLVVVECCTRRDYLGAMDQYIKLAIGNAPWPIGVTMVGIHERSAREKIYTNSVSHIMNDEITRKYLQSVKRLMTFCQRRYPTDPSRSVEFNSLANGSDLQSLLAEQKARGSGSEERLQCIAAA